MERASVSGERERERAAQSSKRLVLLRPRLISPSVVMSDEETMTGVGAPRQSLALLLLFLLLSSSCILEGVAGSSEVLLLMHIKAALDPEGRVLRSWIAGGTPCSSGAGEGFEGVVCDGAGMVANISLQGRGLAGFIPSAIAELGALTGLYLHYNKLQGTIPAVLYKLTGLTDLYLNVNLLSGTIPAELGLLYNLQALQLCCNALEGQIPMQLAPLKQLTLLALQHNHLGGEIPSSMGYLVALTRLDLSFNELNGSIPASLGRLPQLAVLDVTGNQLSGSVPPALRGLQQGFEYGNNSMLCGDMFTNLPSCDRSAPVQRPQPLGTQHTHDNSSISTAAESADPLAPTRTRSKTAQTAVVSGVIAFALGGTIIALLIVVLFRRHKQKISSAFEFSDTKFGCRESYADNLFKANDAAMKNCKSLVPDRPASSQRSSRSFGSLSGTVVFNGYHESVQYDLGELEVATNFFSDKNLLGKKHHSAVYKGILRDGSIVAIRTLYKASCKAGLAEFKAVVETLAQLRHENIVALKGFCCSSGRAEFFLVYDFVTNGSLQEHLEKRKLSFLGWSARARIALNVAQGLHFMHRDTEDTFLHQNVSAGNVLLDYNFNAFLSDCGLHKLLVDDMVFAVLKSSAAHGYLAPEYVATGRLTEKSDVYAFGVLLLQLLTGKTPFFVAESDHGELSVVSWARSLAGGGGIEGHMDGNLGGKYSRAGAMHMAAVAFACTHEDARERPDMSQVVSLLRKPETCAETVLSSSGEDNHRRQEALFASS